MFAAGDLAVVASMLGRMRRSLSLVGDVPEFRAGRDTLRTLEDRLQVGWGIQQAGLDLFGGSLVCARLCAGEQGVCLRTLEDRLQVGHPTSGAGSAVGGPWCVLGCVLVSRVCACGRWRTGCRWDIQQMGLELFGWSLVCARVCAGEQGACLRRLEDRLQVGHPTSGAGFVRGVSGVC